ncbi:hypothetical protein P691DRAFT_803008 [Macrolepiota fuliginosa MF-IS2]|uniref:Uncharacterized protein n=1 Tax=Macrolepiota fuliginosa MF-IS2 TaxID=1400762 RepID=A0A9P6C3A5_9AGAR|nr:hypothetical protein P691DRAFT_803008 [Macrolepiota fuliginosa MF-IS2]
MAAIWSEAGRLRREGREKGELDIHATEIGVVVEQQLYSKTGRGIGKTEFAMGAEPQILSDDNHGPLGTASTPLSTRLDDMAQEADLPPVEAGAAQARDAASEAKKKVKGIMKEERGRITSFEKSVEDKAALEKQRSGWQSAAFDF